MDPRGMRRETSLTATKSPKLLRTLSRTIASLMRGGGRRKEEGGLGWRYFERAGAPLLCCEAFHVFQVRFRVVLLAIRYVHCVQEFLARDPFGTHGDLPVVGLDVAALLLEEGAVPARRFVGPGSDEHALADHH